MKTVPIRYVGPFDEVEIAATGDFVKQGEVIEVDAELAGRPPGARLAEARDELAALIEQGAPKPAADVLTADELAAIAAYQDDVHALEAEVATADAGVGLLAQETNWQPAKKASDKPADKPETKE